MTAVSSLCSKGILLKTGKLSKQGKTNDVVEKYLLQQSRSTLSRKWSWPGDAPGDDRVRLLEVKVLQNSKGQEFVNINELTEISMRFQILKTCKNVVCGFNFYDLSGICLFSHADWRPNNMKPGKYIKKLKIPAQTFAEGFVKILSQIVFYDPLSTPIIIPDTVSFEAIELDSPEAVRGPYKGPWPGAVRLGLNWSESEEMLDIEQR